MKKHNINYMFITDDKNSIYLLINFINLNYFIMKKTVLLTMIMGLFFTYEVMAQVPGDTLWTRTYGENNTYDYAECVQQTTDNGYVLAGVKFSFETFIYGMFVVKTDTNGDTLWTNTYGEGDINFAYSVQETSDNGFIISGLTATSFDDDPDYYLVKTDPLGDTLWTRTYGGTGDDISTSVQQTTDGGYIVAGYTNSFGAGINDIYLVKTDENGDTLWTRTYGGTEDDNANSVQQTTDGGYIIGGYTRTGDVPDSYLIKIDAIGDTIWTKTYIYGDASDIKEVQQTNDNGYILAGWTSSGPGAGGYDWLLIKTDSNGDTLWTRTYGKNDFYDVANSVQQTNDGGYILAGWGSSDWQSGFNCMLIKTDSYGDTLWTRIYGGAGDIPNSVKQTTDGGYIVAGFTELGNGDMLLLRIYDITTGIKDDNPFLSKTHSLFQNYPNPFKSSTTISFSVEGPDKNINITIHNLNGQKIKTLVDKKLNAGTHQIVWDGTDDSGNPIPSGIYFYKMECGDKYTGLKKMILMK